MLKKIFQSLLELFVKTKGHPPGTYELRKLKDQAKSIVKQREKTKPFEGFTPKIVGIVFETLFLSKFLFVKIKTFRISFCFLHIDFTFLIGL